MPTWIPAVKAFDDTTSDYIPFWVERDFLVNPITWVGDFAGFYSISFGDTSIYGISSIWEGGLDFNLESALPVLSIASLGLYDTMSVVTARCLLLLRWRITFGGIGSIGLPTSTLYICP